MQTEVNGIPETPALPAAIAPALKLTKEETLEIQVLYLQVQNLTLQMNALREDIAKAVPMRAKAQSDMQELQKRLSEKYGVDMTAVQISQDGTITQPSR